MTTVYESDVEMDALLPCDAPDESSREDDGRASSSTPFSRGAIVAALALAFMGTLCVFGSRDHVTPVDGTALISQALVTPATTGGSVIPSEKMNDGNKCRDDEELYGPLCYRKCSLLTGVPSAVRKNAFSCCTVNCDDIFSFLNWDTPSTFPCTGYDVSSADGNRQGHSFSCPHGQGACLKNEEQNWGQCYEKCSILTGNRYPYRTAAATCCQKNPAENPLSCIDPFETKTSPKLAVGGGAGDGNKITPSGPHYPQPGLTEATATSPTTRPTNSPN